MVLATNWAGGFYSGGSWFELILGRHCQIHLLRELSKRGTSYNLSRIGNGISYIGFNLRGLRIINKDLSSSNIYILINLTSSSL